MAESGFLHNVVHFINQLRMAGIPVSVEQSAEFTHALTLIDISSRNQVYHAARSLLLNRRENMRLFDALFNTFWRIQPTNSSSAQPMPVAPRHNVPKREQFNIVTYMAFKARHIDQEIDVMDKSGTYSNADLIQRKQFSAMSPEELETIKQLMQEMRWQVSLRKTRRRVPNRHGDQLHLRKMMRSAAKHNGVPVMLNWQSPKIKQRPIILLADISGSMEKYARLILQFFFSVSHSLRDVECFVFGSRLSRITSQLKIKNIDRAITEASRDVVDWAGGTRIGESLRAFNHQWSRRVLRRGAIVIIVSDGWERGDPSQLKKEMRYLQHRCHRLIWLNPLSGSQTYQPQVEGMASALPYVDDFLPIHNMQSLHSLATHLTKLKPN